MPNWLLPENISDCLPSEARRMESLRRRLLDLFETYGYELVQPPLLEYAQALADSGGPDLDVRMLKLVDQVSGRMLGLRADMTPQVARIDAHRINRKGVSRLSYCGSVLHARPQAPGASRELQQIGAELYGHSGIEADIEIMGLMLDSLGLAGLKKLRVDIGHLGLLRAVLALDANLVEDDVFPLLTQRDIPALQQILGVSPARAALLEIASLQPRSIEQLQARLPSTPTIQDALVECRRLLASSTLARFGEASFAIDLADAHGYGYHSGMTFSVFRMGESEAIGRGGRYDGIGSRFGRARTATGFSLDLRALSALTPGTHFQHLSPKPAIFAPLTEDHSVANKVAQLRAAGHVVIQQLADSEFESSEFVCDRQLRLVSGEWQVVAV